MDEQRSELPVESNRLERWERIEGSVMRGKERGSLVLTVIRRSAPPKA